MNALVSQLHTVLFKMNMGVVRPTRAASSLGSERQRVITAGVMPLQDGL